MKKIDEDKVITYTDVVGTLMSSVTDIVDVISYVLIAFVGISRGDIHCWFIIRTHGYWYYLDSINSYEYNYS